jgi:hypothetical protein
MIKKLCLFGPVILLLFAKMAVCQGQSMDKIEAEKIAFFTEKMSLTPSEASVFWPLYNEYQEKKHELNRKKNSVLIYFKTNQNQLSESEVNTLTERYVSYQKQEGVLLESYTQKFREILPVEKVLQIYITEAEFRKYLIDQIRKRKVTPNLRDNR